MRKRKDIKYNDSFDEVDENDAPDSIEHGKATETCPVLKSVSTEEKRAQDTADKKVERVEKRCRMYQSYAAI